MHLACSSSVRLAVATVVGCALVACTTPTAGEAVLSTSSDVPSNSHATAAPTTISNTLPAPHPPANEHTDGSAFEPCTAFTADELKGWGVDPTKVDDIGVENPLLRGCRWRQENRSWSLAIRVHNATVEKYLQQDSTLKLQEPITIAGKSGAMNSSDGRQNQCDVVLPSQQAVVIFTVRVYSGDEGPRLVPDACNKAIDVATAVAPRLP
ncbi:DUF3558 domain-containing protein [Mycobacterium sp. D16Q16]|uniref:DUF3558 domain-containing protein n=1 Tax=Mycobacterium sp. D16Q16 TaxID=1855659 RepID=UPI000993B6D4